MKEKKDDKFGCEKEAWVGLKDSFSPSLTHSRTHSLTHTHSHSSKHTHTHANAHSKPVYTFGGFCLFAQKLICSLMHDWTFQNGERSKMTQKSFSSTCCESCCNSKSLPDFQSDDKSLAWNGPVFCLISISIVPFRCLVMAKRVKVLKVFLVFRSS